MVKFPRRALDPFFSHLAIDNAGDGDAGEFDGAAVGFAFEHAAVFTGAGPNRDDSFAIFSEKHVVDFEAHIGDFFLEVLHPLLEVFATLDGGARSVDLKVFRDEGIDEFEVVRRIPNFFPELPHHDEGRFGGCGIGESLESGYDLVGGGAVAVFGVEKGPLNRAVRSDDVGGAEREHSFVVVGSVVVFEPGIRAHRFFDPGNHLEDGAVFLGDFIVEIGEDFEAERELFGVGERFVGELGSEGDELATRSGEVFETALVFCQSEVAIGTPRAAIPSEDHGSLLEHGAESNLFAGGVFKSEVGSLVANVEGFVEDAGLSNSVDSELVLGCFLGGDSFFEISFARI